MSDMEYEEVMVNESSVFDTSYFTHHCSTIPNLQSQYYAEPLCCFHALKTQRKTRGKVDIVEMFGGKQGIAKIAIRRNLSMGRNWDLETGIDLTNKDHIAAFKDYVVSVQPFIILAGPPCTALGGWSYLNRIKHPETWLPTRHIAEALAELTAWACLLQLKSSRHFLIENPVPSDLWNLPCWLPVKAHACVVFAIFDQCMMGQCDPDGIPTRKATGLLASHDILVQDFHVRCDGSHVHVSLEGSVRGISRCRYAQTWPRRMLECICKAVKKLMNQDQSCMDTLLAFPVIEPLRCAGCRAHAVRTDIRHSRIPNECRFTADTGIEWGCPACRRHLPSTHLGHMLDSGDCQWSIARRRARGGGRVVADAPPAEGVATALAPEPMPAALRNPRVLEQRRPESEELTVEPPPSVGTLKWQPVTDEDLLEYLKRYAITDGWKFIRGQHWIVESQVRNLRTCEPRHDSKSGTTGPAMASFTSRLTPMAIGGCSSFKLNSQLRHIRTLEHALVSNALFWFKCSLAKTNIKLYQKLHPPWHLHLRLLKLHELQCNCIQRMRMKIHPHQSNLSMMRTFSLNGQALTSARHCEL
jgi:hypothetical protein